MRLTQETKQTQHLAMTAQLRQAIHILQLSASALEEELERAYMENPLLEMEEGGPPLRDEHPNMDWMAHDFHGADDMDTAEDRTARDTWEPAAPVALSLEEALLREVDFCFSDEEKKAIAVFLIGSLDHRGYLTLPLAEAARATGTCVPDVTEVLRVLQSFEPAGIGARDLAECMRLQAERADLYHGLLRAVIERHLPAVAEGRYRAIARAEGASLAAVQAAVDVLRIFSPKPGSAYGAEPPSYIRADVRLAFVDGKMQVTVCSEYLPQLRISRLYRNTADLDQETRSYIARRIYAARALIRAVGQRGETLRRVAEELVHRQADFVVAGAKGLHPLSRQTVAAALGMHESTISRTVANKYIDLPRGIVPLKAFFSSAVGVETDTVTSAEQVRRAVSDLIAAEDEHAPLSDAQIADRLSARGMTVARRTVMKYRTQLGITSSSKRRRY